MDVNEIIVYDADENEHRYKRSAAAMRAAVIIASGKKKGGLLSLSLANFEWAHRSRGIRNIGSFSTIS
jgi:hypothetical protein